MRTIRYSVAMSLDGFIAGPGGDMDWLPGDIDLDWNAFMDRFDTVLMGRKTYEFGLSHGMDDPAPGKRSFIFSTTLHPDEHPKVTIVADGAAEVVRGLREEDGKEIWLMGGGVLFRSLLAEGLVDLIEIAIVPILLGEGIPFVATAAERVPLTRLEVREYGAGVTMLVYRTAD